MQAEPEREIREGIAAAKGIALYGEYTEAEAAAFLDLHARTLADVRREGRIAFVRKGPRNIRYLGLHIADFVIDSIEQRDAITAKPPEGKTPTPKAKDQSARISAYGLAEKTFGRPNSS